jgi:hypothetical protein
MAPRADDPELPFWQRKPLSQMTDSEWESLGDEFWPAADLRVPATGWRRRPSVASACFRGPRERARDRHFGLRRRVKASEEEVPDAELQDRIVSWPVRWPKGAKRA